MTTKNQFDDILDKILKTQDPLNILIVGGTGVGKSSTINALFEIDSAKVGSIKPETMKIEKYQLKNIILWDSPGIGDGNKDESHKKQLIEKLREIDNDGNLLIDIVIVIIDGSNRDLSSSFELINNILIPEMGEGVAEKRLIIAMNKADKVVTAQSFDKVWNRELNQPKDNLQKIIDEKLNDIKQRILDATNVNINPMCYSAGYYNPEFDEKLPPYNISKLLKEIIESTPKEKRVQFIRDRSKSEENTRYSDGKANYNEAINESFLDSFLEGARKILGFIKEHTEDLITIAKIVISTVKK